MGGRSVYLQLVPEMCATKFNVISGRGPTEREREIGVCIRATMKKDASHRVVMC